MTPCATVTLAATRCSPPDVVRIDLGRDRGRDQVLVQWNHSALQQQACVFHARDQVCILVTLESFITPGNYANPPLSLRVVKANMPTV